MLKNLINTIDTIVSKKLFLKDTQIEFSLATFQ